MLQSVPPASAAAWTFRRRPVSRPAQAAATPAMRETYCPATRCVRRPTGTAGPGARSWTCCDRFLHLERPPPSWRGRQPRRRRQRQGPLLLPRNACEPGPPASPRRQRRGQAPGGSMAQPPPLRARAPRAVSGMSTLLPPVRRTAARPRGGGAAGRCPASVSAQGLGVGPTKLGASLGVTQNTVEILDLEDPPRPSQTRPR